MREPAPIERLLRHLPPKVLLGLTATPERTDADDILHYFDKHISVEMRLWDALERELAVPVPILSGCTTTRTSRGSSGHAAGTTSRSSTNLHGERCAEWAGAGAAQDEAP